MLAQPKSKFKRPEILLQDIPYVCHPRRKKSPRKITSTDLVCAKNGTMQSMRIHNGQRALKVNKGRIYIG